MLMKDKDILAQDTQAEQKVVLQSQKNPTGITKEHMREAWGDAFDYYLRGITQKYMQFGGRASRLEFWGFAVAGTLLYIPLYMLGAYIEMPLLPYYYGLATLIPTMAVASRRLHDIHKKATIPLSIFTILVLLGFFFNYYILILATLWGFLLVRYFSKDTALEENEFFGEPSVNDEIYEQDNLPIIRKFRFIALVMSLIWAGMTLVTFDDWSRQATLRATNARILDEITQRGEAAHLSPAQIRQAEQEFKKILKSGVQTVSEDQLNQMIDNIIKAIATPVVVPAPVKEKAEEPIPTEGPEDNSPSND